MKLLPQISLQINNPIQIHRIDIKNPLDRLPQVMRQPSNRHGVQRIQKLLQLPRVRRGSRVHAQQRLHNPNPSEERERVLQVHQVGRDPRQLRVLHRELRGRPLREGRHIALLHIVTRDGEVGDLRLARFLPRLPNPSYLRKREFAAVRVQETHQGVRVSGTFFFFFFFGGRLWKLVEGEVVAVECYLGD